MGEGVTTESNEGNVVVGNGQTQDGSFNKIILPQLSRTCRLLVEGIPVVTEAEESPKLLNLISVKTLNTGEITTGA